MEMERLLVQEFANAQPSEFESQSDILVVDENVALSRASSKACAKKTSKPRFQAL
jgi:hypothetical protein